MDNLAFEHGGNIYQKERIYKRKFLDFSANINPLGLPPRAKEAIYKNLGSLLHYPDSEAKNITQKIAQYWGIKEENVLVGNGSIELIYLITSTFKPKITIIPMPTFSEYERAAKNVKSRIQFLKLEEEAGFRFNLPHLGKADIFFLCNPNNPTGNLIIEDRRLVEQLADKLLVVDEAFMDFLPNQKNYTLIWKAVKRKKIVVLRSFTKFFGLPGLRIGYIIAHREIVNKLKQYQPPWNTNSLAQIAAEATLDEKEYINETYKIIERERGFLFKEIAKIEGLKPYPSVANFLLIKIEKSGIASKSLKGLLIKKGILIRDCSNFRNLNNKYIRVAVRTHKENLKLLRALKKAI